MGYASVIKVDRGKGKPAFAVMVNGKAVKVFEEKPGYPGAKDRAQVAARKINQNAPEFGSKQRG